MADDLRDARDLVRSDFSPVDIRLTYRRIRARGED